MNLWQYHGIWFRLINDNSYYECSVIKDNIVLKSFRDNSPIEAELQARAFCYEYIASIKN